MIGYSKSFNLDRTYVISGEDEPPAQPVSRWQKRRRLDEMSLVCEYTDPETGDKLSAEAELYCLDPYCIEEASSAAMAQILNQHHSALMELERRRHEAMLPELREKLKAADGAWQRLEDEAKAYPSFQAYYNEHCADYEAARETYEELDHQLQATEAKLRRWESIRRELADTQLPNSMEQYITEDNLGLAFFREGTKDAPLYCIDYGGKHLQAETIEELRKLVSIEEDRINRENGYSLLTNRSAGTIAEAKRRVVSLSATDSVYVLEMFYQAVFGEKEEREAARLRIYRTLYLEKQQQDVNEKDLEKTVHEKLEDLARQEEVSMQQVDKFTFFNYLLEYLHNRKVITQTELAKKLGCHNSYITHIKNGELKTLKRKWVVGMAVAFRMEKEDMRRFIHSAGFAFPCFKSDFLIEERMELGIRDYYAVMKGLEEKDISF